MSSPLIHRHHISLPAGIAQSRGSPRATPGFVFGYGHAREAPAGRHRWGRLRRDHRGEGVSRGARRGHDRRQRNLHAFSPLLYQLATAGLAPDDIAPNLRGIVQRDLNVDARIATVQASTSNIS
jgi:hypothetical protein